MRNSFRAINCDLRYFQEEKLAGVRVDLLKKLTGGRVDLLAIR